MPYGPSNYSLLDLYAWFDKKFKVFTGIVESSSEIIHFEKRDNSVYRIQILKPISFTDIKVGDSICTNGVCLTITEFNDEVFVFDIGPETIQITGWDEAKLLNKTVNLERSMRFGDRIHGHILSGHVDEVGQIISTHANGEAWDIVVELSEQAKKYVWKKGSIGLSGVSLTVNEFKNLRVSVCLVPETLRITNLSDFKPGEFVNIEYDWMAKAFLNQIKNIPLKEIIK